MTFFLICSRSSRLCIFGAGLTRYHVQLDRNDTLRKLPIKKKIQGGAANMIRQAKDIECAIQSVSSWASKTLGEVRRHRAGTHLQGLCHSAKCCRLGLAVGIVRVTCNEMCASSGYHNGPDARANRLFEELQAVLDALRLHRILLGRSSHLHSAGRDIP